MRTTIMIAALVLAGCASTTDRKAAVTARNDHFENNVHAQQTLAVKQHAERASLANRQAREREEAGQKTLDDFASDNAKIEAITASIAKEHRVFAAEARDRIARLDARSRELEIRSNGEPPSVRRTQRAAWLAFWNERAGLEQRMSRLATTSDAMWPSAESAIEVHTRMADAALDTVAAKLK